MTSEPIVKTVELGCDAAHAFDVFVNRIAVWWPMDHAASAAAGQNALGVTIEPRVGGAVYETMHDGSRNDWGEVLEFEAGRRLAMTWHPGNNADNATQVTVDFKALEAGRTRVTLTHSGWDIWGDAAAERRDNYDNGWNFVFGQRFFEAAQP